MSPSALAIRAHDIVRWPDLRFPPAAEIPINLDEAEQFIQLRLSQPEFSAKGLGLICQHFQVTGSPTAIADVGKPCRVSRCRHQLLLTLADFMVLLKSDQGHPRHRGTPA